MVEFPAEAATKTAKFPLAYINRSKPLYCGNFFDHIDDFLDFPSGELDADSVGGCGDSDAFAGILPGGSSAGALVGFKSVFSGNSASDPSAELAVPSCNIDEEALLSAISSCNMLETLDIRFCPKIGSVTMAKFRVACLSLKRVYRGVSTN